MKSDFDKMYKDMVKAGITLGEYEAQKKTKKEYLVTVREVYTHMVSVEANSDSEAIRLVSLGEGEALDHTLEFSHAMDEANWTVEEV